MTASPERVTDSAPAPFLDVSDPAFSVRSAAVRAAREQSWYAGTPYGLAVLRHDPVSRLLKHPKVRQGSAAWPAHNGVTHGPFARWWASWILNKEGEEHHRLRRLLNPAFARSALTTLSPSFVSLAHELIDGFAATGRCEFVSQFAEPYAARVVAKLLGLPEDEWETVAAESATIGLAMGVTLKDDLPRIETALARLFEYCDGALATRRAAPTGDFTSRLLSAQRDEDALSETELRDAMVLLVFGGFDTTRNQLGLAIRTFLAHPDQWRLLAERPELGAAAVEEVMRVDPTVTWVTREALEDFTFDGLDIAAGTTLHLFTESAGTDPRAMPDPSFDVTATDRPAHFGFGGGTHHCLGHFVGRSDMSIALPLLAQRMPDLRYDGEPVWLPDSGNTGAVRLPLAFSPTT
jgi:cytochrome P450